MEAGLRGRKWGVISLFFFFFFFFLFFNFFLFVILSLCL